MQKSKVESEERLIAAWEEILADWEGLCAYHSFRVTADTALRHDSSKTKHLWMAGIPGPVRGRVWSQVLGNPLQIDLALFGSNIYKITDIVLIFLDNLRRRAVSFRTTSGATNKSGHFEFNDGSSLLAPLILSPNRGREPIPFPPHSN